MALNGLKPHVSAASALLGLSVRWAICSVGASHARSATTCVHFLVTGNFRA